MEKQTWQDKKDQVKNLLDSIHERLENHVHTKEDILELMAFNSKFHQYSLRNMLLIDQQFKGANAVGSYQFWKEHGFQVQRGEKGIQILTPVKTTLFKGEDGNDKSLRYATKEEKELIKRGDLETRQLTTFKVGYVFDVSQTNAKASDLPKIFPNRWLDGSVPNYSQFYQGLEKVAESIDVKIIDPKKELGVSKGVSYTGLNEVALNPRNGELQNIKTLLHELAHAKMHTLENHSKYTKAEREFQAELVAYAVCSHFNLDVSDYSLDYLKAWTKNTDIKNKIHLIDEVYQTSQDYIGVLEEHFELEKSKTQSLVEEIGREDQLINDLFPDEDFRKAILEDVFFQPRESSNRDLYNYQLEAIQSQVVLSVSNSKVKDLTGIEQFHSLKQLDISYNPIQKFDMSNMKELRSVSAYNCALTEITLPNPECTSLRYLDVSNNQLVQLNLDEQENLKTLCVGYNKLESLGLKDCESLQFLSCSNNHLKELFLEDCYDLTSLDCDNNYLRELNISNNEELIMVSCSNNLLTSLEMNHCKSLEYLECVNNQLEVLEINSLEKVKNVDCRGNFKSSDELIHGISKKEKIEDLEYGDE